ncbi:hypothetical protein FIBSPDRAFT_878382 [Athelia psychrophila]|nr:hypothetical protein FIBSPDRAFT_878382 [Fibularhizoctonia sp. CBS 109695]
MVGFRAAGWTCFAAAMMSLLISVIGLWGTGIVGAAPSGSTESSSAIELNEKLGEGSV